MKKIIISILGVLSLFGCVDLKQEPLSFLTPENVSYDESNMTTMANGLYRALWGLELRILLPFIYVDVGSR